MKYTFLFHEGKSLTFKFVFLFSETQKLSNLMKLCSSFSGELLVYFKSVQNSFLLTCWQYLISFKMLHKVSFSTLHKSAVYFKLNIGFKLSTASHAFGNKVLWGLNYKLALSIMCSKKSYLKHISLQWVVGKNSLPRLRLWNSKLQKVFLNFSFYFFTPFNEK